MPPAIPDKIPCESIQDLAHELADLRDALSFEETEETWDRIARALTRFGAVVKGGGYKFEKDLVHAFKTSAKPIISAMNSERTRLSAASLECITIIAPRIGLAFEILVPLYVPHILRLATRSNKVYVTRCQATLTLIIGYCHIPTIISHLLAACKESKIVTGRVVAIEGVLRCLNKWDWSQKDIKNKVGDVEEVIRVTGRDKDAGIRQTSRKIFEAYRTLFPERVDEFTGPLTPVMRKYLAIKPLVHTEKQAERAIEKPRRPPTKPDLAASTSAVPSTTHTDTSGGHARSASSNAVIEGSSTSTATSNAHAHRSMLPPATIPSHARSDSSRSQSRDRHHQEQNSHNERKRVMSTTSNYSTKSAPSNPHPDHGTHQPPVRLTSSQSPSTRNNPVVAGSCGQARRVRKAVPVEPHPANRPDPMAIAHKAPVRPTPHLGTTAPRVGRSHKGPARDVTQPAPTTGVGIAFPSSAPASTVPVERKGAQRVPKPVQTTASTPTTPPKAERPATATSMTPKREVKPSIFRRGAPGQAEKKDEEKKKEGFAPRRGGGILQPTLSQLSKQKASASGGPAVSTGSKVAGAHTGSNRPAWGSSGIAKPSSVRGLSAARGRGRGGITRAPTARQEKTQVKPAMVPLPASPGRERDIVPQLIPLPASPRAMSPSGDLPEATPPNADEELHLDEEGAEEALEPVCVSPDHEPDEIEDHSEEAEEAGPRPTARDGHAVLVSLPTSEVAYEPVDPVQDTGKPHNGELDIVETWSDIPTAADRADAFADQTPVAPHTPPFPSTDTETDEDELDAIEFTTRDAYAPNGMPIKTPRKVMGVVPNDVRQERNPLGEVILNE